MNRGQRLLGAGFLLAVSLLLIDVSGSRPAYAQKGGKQGAASSKNDPKFLELFRDAVGTASKSTYRIVCDGKDTALGVAVTADGFLLTKASDLTGKIAVRTHDGLLLPAKLVGVHEAHDLAMLKVEATGFLPVEWSDTRVVRVGHFVVSCGTGALPAAVGVVSVAARDVPVAKGGGPAPKGGGKDNGAQLGVWLDDSPKGALVTELMPNTPAVKANLKAKDIITAWNDKAVKDSTSLLQMLAQHKPGDTITLKVLRGDEELQLQATLGKKPAGPARADVQNNMGSKLSNRRTGFPVVLQHDSVVLPEDCGGPLVDLEGRVIGINIARAGRVESYAIPAETIRPLLGDLMSGKLAPK
jgi:serine protease Do